MATRTQIPIYSALSPKQRQYVHMALGGTAMLCVALFVSGMIGGPEMPTAAPKELPKPRPIAGAPGSQLDAKDAWMGGAGKELAKLKDELKKRDDEVIQLRGDLKTTRDQVSAELQALRERGVLTTAPAQAPGSTLPPLLVQRPATAASGAAVAAPAMTPQAAPAGPAVRVPNAAPGQAANAPMSFPVQQTDRLPAPNAAPTSAMGARALAGSAYPPGTPMVNSRPGQDAAAYVPPPPPVPALMKVSLGAAAAQAPDAGKAPAPGAAAATTPAAAKEARAARSVSSFLPVGFTRAVLLGGLAAPTGGQAQSNPVPVLLRMADLSVLPNGYRAHVKDCLVIGEGYGEHSAERAYIRATLLSCVMHDGQVLEVPIKGSVFGEDGMNGMMGKLITKQGAILGNALLSGIAAGIGQGVAQAGQVTTTTALGNVSSSGTDTSSILRQGFGTGVGKALDRLAQYYINLAERTFPVIEVLPGRIVDIVIQQGVPLDVALATVGPAKGLRPVRGTAADADRSQLVQLVQQGAQAAEDDE